MERTDFYTNLDVDGKKEHDFLQSNISKFEIFYPLTYYRVTQSDLMRPDLISYKMYRTVKYWWLICYINNIDNPFADIKVGELLKIPNSIDIYNFYKTYNLK